MAIETVLVFASGVATIVGIMLAVRVFVEIVEIRDRRRARYHAARSVGRGSPPDVTDPNHHVMIVRTRKGYRLTFYDQHGHHLYSVDLVKVDSSSSE